MPVRFCLFVQARNQFRPPENMTIYSEKQRNFTLADFSMSAELPFSFWTMPRNYVLFLKFNYL